MRARDSIVTPHYFSKKRSVCPAVRGELAKRDFFPVAATG